MRNNIIKPDDNGNSSSVDDTENIETERRLVYAADECQRCARVTFAVVLF